MQLPFTKEQFFDLCAVYNAALWPALVALWIASVVQRPLRPPRAPDSAWCDADRCRAVARARISSHPRGNSPMAHEGGGSRAHWCG
jgi:hypothetical protein